MLTKEKFPKGHVISLFKRGRGLVVVVIVLLCVAIEPVRLKDVLFDSGAA
jgi:hypothetical protein